MSEDIRIMRMDSYDLTKKIINAQEHINAAVSRFHRLKHAKKQLDRKINNQIKKEEQNHGSN